MKRFALAFVAVVFLSAGTASADKGWWFGGGVGNNPAWSTIMNITNHSGADSVVVVTFYDLTSTLIGSTFQTLAANETWNFSTFTVGTIPNSSFDPGAGGSERGSVTITSDATDPADVFGYTTVFNSTASAGFNFRIPYTENP